MQSGRVLPHSLTDCATGVLRCMRLLGSARRRLASPPLPLSRRRPAPPPRSSLLTLPPSSPRVCLSRSSASSAALPATHLPAAFCALPSARGRVCSVPTGPVARRRVSRRPSPPTRCPSTSKHEGQKHGDSVCTPPSKPRREKQDSAPRPARRAWCAPAPSTPTGAQGEARGQRQPSTSAEETGGGPGSGPRRARRRRPRLCAAAPEPLADYSRAPRHAPTHRPSPQPGRASVQAAR